MADVNPSPLVDAVLGKLVDESIQEIASLWNIEKELVHLRRALSSMKIVLGDAENKQPTDEAVRIWLRELKDVAYDAEDIVDECAYHVLKAQVESRNQISKMKEVSIPILSFWISKYNMSRQIREIQERLDEIAKRQRALHLNKVDGGRQLFHKLEKQPPTSSFTRGTVLGRADDREKMINMLLSSDGDSILSNNISVIPLVGKGGVGKTTLVQDVYNNERIKKHFLIRAWVCVSDDFEVKRVTKAILESIINRPCYLNELDPIQVLLRENLIRKKFLVVLDDICDEDKSKWQSFLAPFCFGDTENKENKIIITARSVQVSTITSTAPKPYCLRGLSQDDGWLLFCQWAFRVRTSNFSQILIETGRKIVEKCKGQPLAICALGGLLYHNNDEKKWESILENEIWELAEVANNILPILKFSYDHLPANLKQCFVYCSIYPKDWQFNKKELVHHWIAHGFIWPDGNKQLVDIGSEYFDYLVLRSFFVQEDNLSYKMHDIVHNLAQSIASDECSIIGTERPCNMLKEARHSSFICQEHDDPNVFELLDESKRLRTFTVLTYYGEEYDYHVSRDFFLKYRCLRVLDLCKTGIRNLPHSIGNLNHLRYLDISYNPIRKLPESVTTLYNLQVLNLRECRLLVALPNCIGNLVNLRHLELSGCNFPTPPGLGKLKGLQALDTFVVGKETGCSISELMDLTDLRGQIHISRLENVINGVEGKDANLSKKEHLQDLTLQWSDEAGDDSQDGRVDEELLEGLQPHPDLKILSIKFYGGVTFPRWMIERDGFLCRNLTNICLASCQNCKLLPPLGQLPLLKILTMQNMAGIEHIGHEFVSGISGFSKGFSSLAELYLLQMDNLEEWSGATEGYMPRLGKLTISGCPKLRELPVLSSLCKLKLERCTEVILRMVPRQITLTSLHIVGFKGLTSLPEGLLQPLTALEELVIQTCDDLVSWPNEAGFHNLPSLKVLKINLCFNFETLPSAEELPTKLEILSFLWFYNLRSTIPTGGLGNLALLKELDFVTQASFLPKVALPGTLFMLQIYNCPNIRTFPKEIFNYLTSLQSFDD